MTSTPPNAAAQPVASLTERATRANARLNGWMRRWSWAVAMTVAIVITVGGLVILESGRMRIATEYETALDAKGATTQLTSLAADVASLDAKAGAVRDAATAAHIRRTVASLDAYYHRKADDTALAGFRQVSAILDARTNGDASARLDASASTDVLDSALAELRLNEERRAQSALDASRADQRISTFCVGALCALNIVLFLLLFRNLGIQLDKQDRVQRKLITQQEELDQLVFERTRQLEALAWHLQSVSENEKTQLARELHDELGSILTASKMDVAWVNGKLKASEPAMAEKLGRALANLDQGIALKRRIIEDMRPTVLANFGLVTALRTLGDEAAQRAGWTLALALPDDDVKLGEEVEIALFRVAQESLNNAEKYARAANVSIALALDEVRVSLQIADNGVGIRPQDLQRTHTHGLLGMRQRVSARGGRIEIQRRSPHGTEIRVTMPRERNFAPDATAQDVPQASGNPL
jgi:signal transduction histidine kinase